MTYLADTSVLARLRATGLDPQWMDAIQAGLVGTCPVVEAELMRGAASRADRDRIRTTLRSLFTWHPIPDSAWRFVERTQDALIDKGLHHGPSVPDLLVAATADAWDLVILHVDKDFDAIARVANIKTRRVGQP